MYSNEDIVSAIRPMAATTLAILVALVSLSKYTTPWHLQILFFVLLFIAFHYVHAFSPYYLINDIFSRFLVIVGDYEVILGKTTC
jgi:hypothetical protein